MKVITEKNIVRFWNEFRRVGRAAYAKGQVPKKSAKLYFTKGCSFENITDDEVETVMNKLNHRPRKTLNFKTPHAVFFAESLQEAA